LQIYIIYYCYTACGENSIVKRFKLLFWLFSKGNAGRKLRFEARKGGSEIAMATKCAACQWHRFLSFARLQHQKNPAKQLSHFAPEQ
jgi:hypothetical protein